MEFILSLLSYYITHISIYLYSDNRH